MPRIDTAGAMEDEHEPPSLVRVTMELIEAGKYGPGGWNAKQLYLIGIKWPPRKGWRHKAIKNLISEENAKLFVALKGLSKKVLRKHHGSNRRKKSVSEDRAQLPHSALFPRRPK